MMNMKKSVYVFWGIAAFCILGAIISIPNLQNVLIYLAAILVFGALGYWQFQRGKTDTGTVMDKKAASTIKAHTDGNSFFSHKVVVLDGEFKFFSRRKLCAILRKKGATIAPRITRNTDILIIGKRDLSKLDANGLSEHERKINSLNEKGLGFVSRISETQLMSYLKK